MFEFYSTEVDFSREPERGIQRVNFIMPEIPSLEKRKSYAIYKMPGCSEIMVSPEEDFYRMIAAIEADADKIAEKISAAKKRDDVSALEAERQDLLNQRNILFANKFNFVYRGYGYPTPVCVTSIFLEEIGVTADNNTLCMAFNTSTGEIILHSEQDRWKYDYSEEHEKYRDRRSFIFNKKFVG
ncbi:MAG: hypothetical protein ACI4I9_05920 [Porcipelethomonas sp.]